MTGTHRSREVGLARALSKLGYCSRSEAFELIHAGRVRLNGAVRRDPEAHVRLEHDRIQVDGQPVATAAKVYLMLNKPRGIVTTASDEKGRQTVYAFLDSELPWIAPVGRLDKASEGLLLLTNDSEWAARVLSPASQVHKTYHVQIDKVADTTLLESIGSGVKTEDGDTLRVSSVPSCVAAAAIAGLKLFWTRARTDTSGECCQRLALGCCDWSGLRLVRCHLVNFPREVFANLRAEEKTELDRAMRDQNVEAGPRWGSPKTIRTRA